MTAKHWIRRCASLAAAMALVTLTAATASAEDKIALKAHPTNYPHRHVGPQPMRGPAWGGGGGRSSIYFGIGVLGNYFFEGDKEVQKVYTGGGGFDLMFGARLAPPIAFEFNYIAAFQSTKDNLNTQSKQAPSEGSVQALSLDAKIFLMPWSERIEPFAQIGVGAYMLSEALQEQLTGVGLDIGGGVDIRLSRFVALGMRLLYRGFYVDNSETNYNRLPTESAFLNTLSIEGNIQFHF